MNYSKNQNACKSSGLLKKPSLLVELVYFKKKTHKNLHVLTQQRQSTLLYD